MIKEKMYCDICKGVIYDEGEPHAGKHNGVQLTLGYSRNNGWGNRENWIDWGSEDICHDCFERLETAVEGVLNWRHNK